MKTLAASIHQHKPSKRTLYRSFLPVVSVSIPNLLALLSAVTVATSIILLTVWAAGTELNAFLGAGIWGMGFIFLGLAVDNGGSKALYQVASGAGLLLLAALQNIVSADFAIVSAVLVASWVAVLMFGHLRPEA